MEMTCFWIYFLFHSIFLSFSVFLIEIFSCSVIATEYDSPFIFVEARQKSQKKRIRRLNRVVILERFRNLILLKCILFQVFVKIKQSLIKLDLRFICKTASLGGFPLSSVSHNSPQETQFVNSAYPQCTWARSKYGGLQDEHYVWKLTFTV